jgi:hypothetical protein
VQARRDSARIGDRVRVAVDRVLFWEGAEAQARGGTG